MRRIVVDNLLYVGSHGGAVFSGVSEDGQRHRLVASYDVMPRPPAVGETWDLEGVVRNHRIYGRQVVTRKAVLVRPSGRLIMRVLAKSADFPGIGEKLADQLWRRFGEDLYALLEAGDPSPFEGPLRSRALARGLVEAWQDRAHLAEAYRWLDRHGAPLALAEKVAAMYQGDTVAKLEENPYRLQALTNWQTADRIARSLGITLEDERRLVAAADAAIVWQLAAKHTWTPAQEFRVAVQGVLGCSPALAARAVELGIADGALVAVRGGMQGVGPWAMEDFLATTIVAMRSANFQVPQMTLWPELTGALLPPLAGAGGGVRLNEAQQLGVSMARDEQVMILHGGAGVGKTTVLKAVCETAHQLARTVHLLALSGRAARRMAEATGRDASTIASFINRVQRGEIVLDGEPLIAVDEASMLDLPVSYRLFRLFQPGCRLLLMGDPGQLPPISFGLVFHTLVESGALPMVELTEVHRQAAATGIPQASAQVRAGTVPELAAYAGRGGGVQFLDCPREAIPERLSAVVADLGGFDEVQILSPVKNGTAGTRDLNFRFHSASRGGATGYDEGFAAGEPVIWTQNDYDLGLMNGSLGKVVALQKGGLLVSWDDGERLIDDPSRMEHAYAITIHKSQGSQFRRVIIPVFQCRLLDRTMLYTAITRAEQQVVLVGNRAAFEKAVTEPPTSSLRRTGLHFALKEAMRSVVSVSGAEEAVIHMAKTFMNR